jgi:hypothetical protein
MIAVGDIITAPNGEQWRVTGIDHNGKYVAEPLAFGSPVALTDDLLDSFGIDSAPEPPAADEAEGWKQLAAAAGRADAHRQAVQDGVAEPVKRSPEAAFAAAKPTRKRKQPEQVRDPRRLGPAGK